MQYRNELDATSPPHDTSIVRLTIEEEDAAKLRPAIITQLNSHRLTPSLTCLTDYDSSAEDDGKKLSVQDRKMLGKWKELMSRLVDAVIAMNSKSYEETHLELLVL